MCRCPFGGRRSSSSNSCSKVTLMSSVGMDICSRGSICGRVFPVVSFDRHSNCRIEWMMRPAKLHASVGLSIIITFPGTLAGMMKEGKAPGLLHWIVGRGCIGHLSLLAQSQLFGGRNGPRGSMHGCMDATAATSACTDATLDVSDVWGEVTLCFSFPPFFSLVMVLMADQHSHQELQQTMPAWQLLVSLGRIPPWHN